jgi:beta-galactosidase
LKTDVRWFELSQGRRPSLKVSGEGLLSFSASHYTPQDLTKAFHTYELKPRPEVIVCVDHLHRGLGTASCGPDTLEPYLVKPGRHRFMYCILTNA